VRYLCTIYNHAYTVGATHAFTGTDPSFDSPLARVVVSGPSLRQAAARAYVKCVGKKRAEQMRKRLEMPRGVIAQETNRRAIAASLRKTARRIGECYELDNFVEAWFIKVEPVPSPRPSHLRLPHPTLLHLSRTPFPS
jgi:hypothetical protein